MACLTVSLPKLLIIMKFSPSVLSFMGSAFGVKSKKSSPNLRSSRFSPMLLSRSFIVSVHIYVYDPFEFILGKA